MCIAEGCHINENEKKRRAHTFRGVDELVSEYAMCERDRRHSHGTTVGVNKARKREERGREGRCCRLHCADIDPPCLVDDSSLLGMHSTLTTLHYYQKLGKSTAQS